MASQSLRQVQVYKNEKNSLPPYEFEKIPWAVGIFHGFSVEYEELRDGVGNYPVAIVELPGGKVETFLLNLIKFID